MFFSCIIGFRKATKRLVMISNVLNCWSININLNEIKGFTIFLPEVFPGSVEKTENMIDTLMSLLWQ